MVQVDVFWSYAIGATFACAAHRQLETKAAPLTTEHFVKTLFYLAVLFAPSGVYLLWRFPGWETMFAGDRNLPAWLVALFAATNVTQGALGFYVAWALIRRGRLHLANLQWTLGYFFMFFILVHGWDGTGYRRFLYAGTIEQWRAHEPLPFLRFPVSAVAVTLYVMGAILLPIMFAMAWNWLRDGWLLDEEMRGRTDLPTARAAVSAYVVTILGLTLGAAIAASWLIKLLGWAFGGLVFVAADYYLLVRPGAAYSRQFRSLTLDKR